MTVLLLLVRRLIYSVLQYILFVIVVQEICMCFLEIELFLKLSWLRQLQKRAKFHSTEIIFYITYFLMYVHLTKFCYFEVYDLFDVIYVFDTFIVPGLNKMSCF